MCTELQRSGDVRPACKDRLCVTVEYRRLIFQIQIGKIGGSAQAHTLTERVIQFTLYGLYRLISADFFRSPCGRVVRRVRHDLGHDLRVKTLCRNETVQVHQRLAGKLESQDRAFLAVVFGHGDGRHTVFGRYRMRHVYGGHIVKEYGENVACGDRPVVSGDSQSSAVEGELDFRAVGDLFDEIRKGDGRLALGHDGVVQDRLRVGQHRVGFRFRDALRGEERAVDKSEPAAVRRDLRVGFGGDFIRVAERISLRFRLEAEAVIQRLRGELTSRGIERTDGIARLDVHDAEFDRQHDVVIILVLLRQVTEIIVRHIVVLNGHFKDVRQIVQPLRAVDGTVFAENQTVTAVDRVSAFGRAGGYPVRRRDEIKVLRDGRNGSDTQDKRKSQYDREKSFSLHV